MPHGTHIILKDSKKLISLTEQNKVFIVYNVYTAQPNKHQSTSKFSLIFCAKALIYIWNLDLRLI